MKMENEIWKLLENLYSYKPLYHYSVNYSRKVIDIFMVAS